MDAPPTVDEVCCSCFCCCVVLFGCLLLLLPLLLCGFVWLFVVVVVLYCWFFHGGALLKFCSGLPNTNWCLRPRCCSLVQVSPTQNGVCVVSMPKFCSTFPQHQKVFASYAFVRGFMGQSGAPNVARAARIILKDYGTLSLLSLSPLSLSPLSLSLSSLSLCLCVRMCGILRVFVWCLDVSQSWTPRETSLRREW